VDAIREQAAAEGVGVELRHVQHVQVILGLENGAQLGQELLPSRGPHIVRLSPVGAGAGLLHPRRCAGARLKWTNDEAASAEGSASIGSDSASRRRPTQRQSAARQATRAPNGSAAGAVMAVRCRGRGAPRRHRLRRPQVKTPERAVRRAGRE
jgi:hypothetical protein